VGGLVTYRAPGGIRVTMALSGSHWNQLEPDMPLVSHLTARAHKRMASAVISYLQLTHSASFPKHEGCCSLSRRCPTPISPGIPTNLIETFHGFPQSLQVNTGTDRTSHWPTVRYLPHLIQFIICYHSTTRRNIDLTTASVVKEVVNIVTCMSDSRRDFGLDIGFIDQFNTRLVITLNYSAIELYKSLEHTLSLFQPAVSSLAFAW
jgi:hypothetical protein